MVDDVGDGEGDVGDEVDVGVGDGDAVGVGEAIGLLSTRIETEVDASR